MVVRNRVEPLGADLEPFRAPRLAARVRVRVQEVLVGADHPGRARLVQGLGEALALGLRCAPAVVVEQEQRGDGQRLRGVLPHRELVLRGEHVELAALLDEVFVPRLATQLARVALRRPELVVSRRPDDLREPAAQRVQRPEGRFSPLGDVPDDQEPVVRCLRHDGVDDRAVALVGDMEVAGGEEMRHPTTVTNVRRGPGRPGRHHGNREVA